MRAPDAALTPEWLDRPDLDPRERRKAIADLRRVNRLLFGRRAAVRTVLGELGARREVAAARHQRLLDVASGSGDVGAAVRRSAARRSVDLAVVALDRELSHLLLGRRWGEVERAVVARAEALPFADRTFDLTLSSLFFHHLDARGKSVVAAEMLRVCRRAALIVDLARSRWAAAAVRLLFPLLGIGRIAREDGLLSIARGWTAEDSRRFVAEPGWSPCDTELRRRFPTRVAIVLRRPAAMSSDTRPR